jgi:uncharacterized protein YqjF (DUF2071 family)
VNLDFLELPARQAAVTADTDHRPWPLPDAPWVHAQTWIDLAFLHWRVEEAELARLVPSSVELETYDGSAWLGITPFALHGFRVRGLPPLPGVSNFPQLNVRTYVTRDGKPGIWLFTLDAGNALAVEAAKRVYKLPYNRATMRCERSDDHVHFDSHRAGASFSARYRGRGGLFHAEAGSLEAFLAERYCAYTEDGGRVYRADIHHPPWHLQRGEALVDDNTMSPLTLPDEDPHVLFSPRQDAVIWPLDEI